MNQRQATPEDFAELGAAIGACLGIASIGSAALLIVRPCTDAKWSDIGRLIDRAVGEAVLDQRPTHTPETYPCKMNEQARPRQ